MTAKVGDFGLARMLMVNTDAQTSISSAHVLKGSVGYVPPKYGLGEKPSTAGDAYSFGVMLLELFTGMSPTHESFTVDLNPQRWTQSSFQENSVKVIDSELLQLGEALYHQGHHLSRKLQFDRLATVIEIGLACTASSPNERMNMSLFTNTKLPKTTFLNM
ncbi:hypothetical protein TIFTF001_040391 [Ficus carica]|uniref:Protein kinase domain-containing protein n=1 Tax=Ficus carica TaxID=3494 RepID=A0AA87ZEA0_FICCA|nr:hypothetical protein TIFTF001_040391 [Ficus carica]